MQKFFCFAITEIISGRKRSHRFIFSKTTQQKASLFLFQPKQISLHILRSYLLEIAYLFLRQFKLVHKLPTSFTQEFTLNLKNTHSVFDSAEVHSIWFLIMRNIRICNNEYFFKKRYLKNSDR